MPGPGPVSRARGFSLLELLVAVALLALMSGVLFGALSLTGRSREGGEQKAEAVAGMRLAHEFLRQQLEAQHPLRLRKVAEFPLMFAGERAEMRFAAELPARISGGGIWYYRLAIGRDGERDALVLERAVPDVNAAAPPEFRDADRSVLGEDIAELSIGYFGFDTGANPLTATPSWRDRWDDRQRLPMMVRIDVKPKQGPAWPTLYVASREAPEAGCRAWDAGQQRCFQP